MRFIFLLINKGRDLNPSLPVLFRMMDNNSILINLQFHTYSFHLTQEYHKVLVLDASQIVQSLNNIRINLISITARNPVIELRIAYFVACLVQQFCCKQEQ